MEYNNFRNELLEALRNHFVSPYHVETTMVTKNNTQQREAFRIHLDGSSIAPTIYPRQIYENNGHKPFSVENIVKQLESSFLDESTPLSHFMEHIHSYEDVKDYIILKVIGQSTNRDLLETIPFYPLTDLAIAFSIFVPVKEKDYGTIQITNAMMQTWGVTKADLYRQAQVNSPRLLPKRIHSMHSFLARYEAAHPTPPHSMYILTNHSELCGASCLAYEHLLADISERFSSSFYILPSSIHECILIPASDPSRLDELTKTVQEVNETVLDPTDILSDHAYYYDRTTGNILSEIS
ncbi:hypothetical protein SAMN02910358_00259 [Lachnospiraceae bacterium XBB1006]|nr:hypothetical protein SAMN02910358_00259 [Lachnospiraceae bacterium XBB1006]